MCSSFHNFSTWGHSPLGVNGTELRNVRISIQSWSWLSSEQMKCVSRRQQSLWCFQFQSFSQYRSKVSKKSEDEIEVLRTNPKVSCLSVSLVWTHWYWSNFYHPEVLGTGWASVLRQFGDCWWLIWFILSGSIGLRKQGDFVDDGLIYIIQKYWHQCWGNWETLLMICPHHTTSLGHCIQASVIKNICRTLSQAEIYSWDIFCMTVTSRMACFF